MAKRKTMNVNQIIDEANKHLARTDDGATQEFKIGVAVLLERILHNTGNYEGYNHNYWLKQGFKEWQDAGEPDFPEKNKYIYGPDGGEYDRVYYKR